jgi:hypothetical protein
VNFTFAEFVLRLKIKALRPREPVSRPVVIVDSDEESLKKEIGRWPWPRTMTSASTIQCFNVASRLEARPKDYRIPIVIGAQTEQQAKEKFATLEIDRIQVKGKTDPETVFHGAWASGTRSRFQFAGITRAHRRMLRSYREQDWARAIETIELCRKAAECSGIATLYDMSAERVEAFRRTPPPDWNGVYEAESKLQKGPAHS